MRESWSRRHHDLVTKRFLIERIARHCTWRTISGATLQPQDRSEDAPEHEALCTLSVHLLLHIFMRPPKPEFRVTALYRALYHTLILLGRPIGGIRPRRLYDALGRRAYPTPEPQWARNRWDHELLLSHHFHLDRNILIHGDYDHELHLLFQNRISPGMTILDVGANLGEMSLHLAALTGPAGVVHAFEPFPAAYERLIAHIRRNHLEGVIRAHTLALSNDPGNLSMSTPAADADNQGIGSIVNHDAARLPTNLTIQATTLDLFVREQAISRIDFIKLDIQGAEYFFLEGARETLRSHRPEIVMEVSPDDLRALGKSSRGLLSLVESFDYRIFNLHAGKPTTPISATAIPADFSAINVLCLPA